MGIVADMAEHPQCHAGDRNPAGHEPGSTHHLLTTMAIAGYWDAAPHPQPSTGPALGVTS